jgi:plasmid stabilization system protein ParE
MSRRLIYRPIARAEFDDAADWFKIHHSLSRSESFVQAVDDVISVILRQPDRFPLDFGDARCAPVQNFPYCLYYRVQPNRIVILGIYHQSRDPAGIHSRI